MDLHTQIRMDLDLTRFFVEWRPLGREALWFVAEMNDELIRGALGVNNCGAEVDPRWIRERYLWWRDRLGMAPPAIEYLLNCTHMHI